jgi:streptogramin lyase
MELTRSKIIAMLLLTFGMISFAVRAQSLPISSLAGRAIPGAVDALGDEAQFNCPTGIAVGSDGTIFVADTHNSTIRKITRDGNVTTFAGLAGVIGSNDGMGTNAQFNGPQGIAVDNSGNIYVADTGNSTIRKITLSGEVTTIAGVANYPNPFDGVGTNALFNHPQALAVDSIGQIYVADTWNYTIRKIATDGTATTLAGRAGYPGNLDGATNRARFQCPTGIAVDTNGTVYVSEFSSHTVRRITADGTVTTIAGRAGSWGDSDGVNDSARFYQPTAIAVDVNGNLYVVDSGNQTLRQITLSNTNWTVTTIAGISGVAGNVDGTGPTAHMNFTLGMAVGTDGLLYLADSGNNTIRVSSFIPPRLHATPGDRTIELSWRTSALNYVVETTTNVADSAPWTPIADPVLIFGDRFTTTNSPASNPSFYRLRAPSN